MKAFSMPLIALILMPVIAIALWDDASKDDEIFKNCGVFVDKTLFIEAFFRHCETYDYKYHVITSPSGFGKTTNLKMLQRFVRLEVDELGRVKNKSQTSGYKLFTDKRLKISEYANAKTVENNLAEYPVVSFSFKGVIQSEDFVVNEMNLLKKFKTLYREYKWLYEMLVISKKNGTSTTSTAASEEDADAAGTRLEEKLRFMGNLIADENDPTSSQVPSTETLYILVQILYAHFKRKVFVFIDDYDAVWVDGLRDNVDKLWFVDVGRHLHEIIYALFRPEMRKCVAHIFMTGTNTIFLHATSNTRNVSYNRFLDDNHHPFTRYYGFSENELVELLERCSGGGGGGGDMVTKQMRHLRSSCNGYTTKKSRLRLFQTSSVVEYLTASKCDKNLSYKDKKHLWLDSGSLNGQWKALFDGTLYQRVKHLVASNQSTTFELYRFCNETELQNFSNILKVQEPLTNITVDWFFSLLFENGYFTYTDDESTTTTTTNFKIPNRCRAKAFDQILIKVDKILESVVKAQQYYNHTESVLKVIHL